MKTPSTVDIEGLAAGDRRTYQHVFDLFYDSLCCFANRYIKDLAGCEDCVQKTFIALWDHRTSISSEVHLKSFLYQVCHNNALNHLKHEQVKEQYLSEMKYETEDQTCFINEVLEEEVERILRQTEQDLPPKCREIFILAMQGRSTEEIAIQLGVTENTIKTQKKIAYKQLKKHVKDLYLLVILLTQ